MKRIILTLAIVGILATVAYGAVIRTWEAHDVKVHQVMFTRHGTEINVNAAYTFRSEAGGPVAGIPTQRFKMDIGLNELPVEVKDAFVTINTWLKDEILAEAAGE